ncbi:Helix-turn-helix domain-containing protein [Neorhodopirellula lusitana]|uniref:Helix-turn-helix domain-containing protein n=1 Tax=Neorhodopirellula lusitana TaxID=445327 RepID=A0ABY1Q6N0_9BACT|nr:helix-turn-helix transcriptional regulator [Neorhodopirellula lusitana]SMP61386.1 Helix-turn-helix domain-containing protein [Neorhodopirellula lusitana]
MQFGDRVRVLRTQRAMTQQDLADRMGVSVSYISKVENGKLHFGDYPSEKFIHKLASELKANEDELLLLADKVPASIRKRIRQRPELFRRLAKLDNATLDSLAASLEIPNWPK